MDKESFIKKFNPCERAVDFILSQESLRSAWENNTNPQWFYGLMKFTGNKFDKQLRLLACDSVRNTPLADGRKVWDLLTDERSRQAVEVAEKFANGDATADELMAAKAAKAAGSAWAAAKAAGSEAAAKAAGSAAEAAWLAAGSAAEAAWLAAGAYQCDQFRRTFAFDDIMAALAAYEFPVED